MIIRTILRFESGDATQPRHYENPCNLLGIDHLPDIDGEIDPRRKPFRRLRGGEATFEDCLEAVGIVYTMAEALDRKAFAVEIEGNQVAKNDISLRAYEGMASGMRATAELAVREITAFIENVRYDMAHHDDDETEEECATG